MKFTIRGGMLSLVGVSGCVFNERQKVLVELFCALWP